MADVSDNGHLPGAYDPFIAERIRQALIEHPDVGELDIHVEIEGETVILTGTVATFERCMRIGEIAMELLPDWHIHSEIEIAEFPESDRTEHLP